MSSKAVSTYRARDQSDNELLQLASFVVGTEEFAVPILTVQEINRMMPITRVPQSPPFVEGVINLRGRIIPVIDLRKRFGFEVADQSSASRIIVVEVDGRVLGFVVDRVHEVLRISQSIVDPAPGMVTSIDSEYIQGIAKLEDRLLILIDRGRLFSLKQLRDLDQVRSAPIAMTSSRKCSTGSRSTRPASSATSRNCASSRPKRWLA